MGLQLALCLRQHTCACIHAGNLCAFESATTFYKAAAMTFPHEENISSRRNFIEERRATTLKLSPSEDEFHPAVMRCESVKAHILEYTFHHRSRCHVIPAKIAPTA